MGFSDQELHGSERAVLKLRPHWWFFIREIGVLAAAMVVAIVVIFFDAHPILKLVAAAGILVALAVFFVRYIQWTNTWFVITTDRIIRRKGVLHREGIEIPLERINTVFFRQTLFQRILGAGSLEIESASVEGSQLVDGIRKPLNVQNEIYRQMEDNENRKYDRIKGAADGDGRPGLSTKPANPTRVVDSNRPSSGSGGGVDRTARIESGMTATPDPGERRGGSNSGSSDAGGRRSSSVGDPGSQESYRKLSIPEQIEQLARLHADGILTEAEFQAKKTELLDRM